jgi:hypothetical protein
VLMDKGIIVGVSHEISLRRSLDFSLFRIATNVSSTECLFFIFYWSGQSIDNALIHKTHLFLHHVLRFHLTNSQLSEAVLFASHYQHLVYFAHTLEILLHGVLEDEADAVGFSSTSLPRSSPTQDGDVSASEAAVLPRVIDFLDHFPDSLEVVVACARKTEVARWEYLFDAVGKPRELFEVNIEFLWCDLCELEPC